MKVLMSGKYCIVKPQHLTPIYSGDHLGFLRVVLVWLTKVILLWGSEGIFNIDDRNITIDE